MKYCTACQRKQKQPIGKNCKRAVTSSDSDSSSGPSKQTRSKRQTTAGVSSSTGQQPTMPNIPATSLSSHIPAQAVPANATAQTVPPPTQTQPAPAQNLPAPAQTVPVSQVNVTGTQQGTFPQQGSNHAQYYQQDQSWPANNQWGTPTNQAQQTQHWQWQQQASGPSQWQNYTPHNQFMHATSTPSQASPAHQDSVLAALNGIQNSISAIDTRLTAIEQRPQGNNTTAPTVPPPVPMASAPANQDQHAARIAAEVRQQMEKLDLTSSDSDDDSPPKR